jgi:MinD superfamily P-loop ATPase
MEIAIISGKGGTGKSSISAAFATIEKPCMVADCDVDASNLYLIFEPAIEESQVFVSGYKAVIDQKTCLNCGECITYCRFDAIGTIDGRVVINQTMCDGCKLCSRICPAEAITIIPEADSRLYAGSFRNGKMIHGRLAPGEENSGRLVDLVREKAKEVAQASKIETIILDGPPGIGCSVISTITGVDYVVIVTEPTLSGLHDLKRTIELVAPFRLKTGVIINKSDLNEAMTREIETYCSSCQIENLANIPFDRQLVDAMVHCKSIIEWAPESNTSQLVRTTYSKIRLIAASLSS